MTLTGGMVALDANVNTAEAAVHNVMPADASGLPQNVFRADSNLYATFTSDFSGGWVCVVDAGVQNPSAASCATPAWGSPNFFVGIGTQLGMPIEGALLSVGQWRLLGGHPSSKQGNSLSDTFTVLPCAGTCDIAGAQAELQAWKDRAESMAQGSGAVCLALNVKGLLGAANAARGMYALAGGGLAAMMLGGAAGAFDYFVDTSTEAMAMSLLKELSCGVRTMMAGIAADPPDPNFDTVAEPEFFLTPDVVDSLDEQNDIVLDHYGDIAEAYDAAAAYGTASRIAYERYQGALEAIPPDLEAAAVQAEATAHFTRETVRALRRMELVNPTLLNAPFMTGEIASAEDFAAAMATRERIRTEGHTQEELEQLEILSPEGRAQLEASYQPYLLNGANLDTIDDPSASLRSLFVALDDDLADTIDAFDAFGRILSVEAAELREEAGTPVNSGPVASFTASATSGTAPLTVTFTSQAIDPDGDDLTLEWDIAGIETLTGPLVSYTFTEPGTYWVSLVATDPGGLWDQAIQAVTVAPAPPPPNQAPVASFTQVETPDSDPLEVTFTSTSTDPDGDELTHTWHFGDGQILNGPEITRTFAAGFIYSVVLVVSDGAASDTASGEVVAGHPPANEPPVSAFTTDVTDGTAPLEVTFTSTATDPDGDDITLTWYLGDGTVVADDATITHTYTAPGTYTAVLHVQDEHGASHVSQRVITVKPASTDPGPPAELTPMFTVGKGYDAAQYGPGAGARIVHASSIHSSTSYSPANILVPNNSDYRTAVGDTTDQEVIVELARSGAEIIDRVAMRTLNNQYALGDFEIALSRGGFAPGDFSTVHSDRMAPNADLQEFTFAAQPARYLRLTLRSNRNDNTATNAYISLRQLSVPTADREGGIVSLPTGQGARFVAASSSAPQTAAIYPDAPLVSTNTGHHWRSETGQVADQWYRFELGGEGSHLVDRIRIQTTNQQQDIANFSLYHSTTGAPADFTAALTDVELPRTSTIHEFVLEEPIDARFLELRDLSPHSGNFVRLTRVEAVTVDGLDVADGTGVGAAIVDFSSQHNTSSQAAVNAIAHGTAAWRSATGQNTDQHLTVLLRDGDTHLIDRVLLSSNAGVPTEAEVWVSTTGTDAADFDRLATMALPNITNLENWIVFEPVEAKFVQIRLPASHSTTNYIGLSQVRVFSVERGGGTEVPFLDLSRSPDGQIVSWAWDFGDGTTSSDPYPVHTFAGPGTYPITLTVTDEAGENATVTGSYTVPELPALDVTVESPTNTVLAPPLVGNEGTSTRYSAASAGAIVEWRFDYDWRASQTSTNPAATFTHSLPDDDTYGFSVNALTADYLWTSSSHEITVLNVAPTINPGAHITGYAGEPLTPLSTVTDPVDQVTCTWDWGDGTTTEVSGNCRTNSVLRVPHVYDLPGTYTVTLTADDGDGGITTDDTLRITATHRPSYLQVIDAQAEGPDLRVRARLMDGLTSVGIGAQPVTVSADDGTPVGGTTDDDGYVEVLLTGTAAAEAVTLSFAGSVLHEAAGLTRPVDAPSADIVFIIDESNSMATYQASVLARVREISQGLGAHLDYRLGLTGYAGGHTSGHGHIISQLTQDMTAYTGALGELRTQTGQANGHDGVVVGMGPDMGFRPAAASCAVLITDASASEIASANPETTKEDALAALALGNTPLFAITVDNAITQEAYGLDGGLAQLSGGDWWLINQFTQDASAVLEALVAGCVETALVPELSLTKDSGVDIVGPGEELTYTLTVNNDGAVTVGQIAVTDELPDGVTFEGASDGGSHDPATNQVTWPDFTLSAGQTRELTVTVRTPSADALGVGDHTIRNTAEVVGDPALGEERDPTNNIDTDETTVRVEEEPAEPQAPLIDALLESSTETDANEWLLTFDVTVTNPGEVDTDYVLEPASLPLPDGVSARGPVTVAALGDAPAPRVTSYTFGAAGVVLAAGDLPPAESHTYRVGLPVLIDADVDHVTDTCEGQTGIVVDKGFVLLWQDLATPAAACGVIHAVVPPALPVDASLQIDHDAPPQGVAPGESFTYTLAVGNSGEAVIDELQVLHEVPETLEILAVEAGGWTLTHGEQLVGPHPGAADGENWLHLTGGPLAVGEEHDIVVTAQVVALDQPPVVHDSGTLTDDLPALAVPPVGEAELSGRVTALEDVDPDNDTATTAVDLRHLTANVTARLVNGASYLMFSVATSPILDEEEVTLQWWPLDEAGAPVPDAEPVLLELGPAEREALQIVPWPGVATDGEGNTIGLPGWRVEDEVPVDRDDLPADERALMIVDGHVLDESADDFPWRFQSRLRFSVNPEAVFDVSYRELVTRTEPEETPSETPTETPSETPTETPSETPTETPSETPSEAPSQAPSEAPSQAPDPASSTAPDATPQPPVEGQHPPTGASGVWGGSAAALLLMALGLGLLHARRRVQQRQ